MAFIDVAVLLAGLEERVDDFAVILVGGALEAVHLQIELLPSPAELGGDQIDELFRRFALRAGGAFNLGAVFVGDGSEHDVVALHAFETRDHFGGDAGIGVPDMRRRVYVIDGSGEVILAFTHCE